MGGGALRAPSFRAADRAHVARSAFRTRWRMTAPHTMGEDHVPSTDKYSPHIHIFFEMEDGRSMAFFECPQDAGEPSGRDPHAPAWVQHFAFEVENIDTLLQAKRDLEAKGLSVVGPSNHDDFITSIYFF